MPTMLEAWTNGREPIALRWWITRSGEVRPGWPAPGVEQMAVAMGWIGRSTLNGAVEYPLSPIDDGILEILDARFPNRRWFAGTWGGAETPGEQVHRRAA